MAGTRNYDSTKRRAQARQTRLQIVGAAHDLFVQHGYGATTIVAIAEAAGVSDQTIYKGFASKRDLLHAVVEATVGGDDSEVPLLRQPWVEQLRDEPDPRRRLRLLVAGSRRIYERTAAIQRVVAEAAATDSEIADLLAANRATRLEHHRELLRLATNDGALLDQTGLDEAADYLWAVMSPEVYELAVERRGWSPDRWEDWMSRTLARVLLGDDS